MRRLFLLFCLFFLSTMLYAEEKHPFYVGIQGGYGNTDWARLISEDDLSATATPSEATGDGFAYGFLLGYEITPRIAIEGNYLRFPDSNLTFLTPNIWGVTSFSSETRYYSVITKLFVLTDTHLRIFGDIGWGYTHRSDIMADVSNSGLTFGLGADYALSLHWSALLSFEYTPGTGVAANNASALYVPYLYSVTLGLAYRF